SNSKQGPDGQNKAKPESRNLSLRSQVPRLVERNLKQDLSHSDPSDIMRKMDINGIWRSDILIVRETACCRAVELLRHERPPGLPFPARPSSAFEELAGRQSRRTRRALPPPSPFRLTASVRA